MKSNNTSSEVHRNALPSGTLLDQVYRIESVLGHGGFGITYYAFDEDLEIYVAIKEFLPQEYAIRDHDSRVLAKSTRDEEFYSFGLKGFLQEAKNLASIHHPNVVKPLRYFKANNTAYLVMEYAKGESLDVYLERHGPVISEDLIRRIFSHVLDGLRAVHEKGLLHRDIKPSNIYLCKSASPWVIDFGAARYALSERSRSLSVYLTPGYAPYEQYSSRGKQGPWTDLYGVGASLYKCMTGESPVSADDRAQVILDKKPDLYQSVKTLKLGKYTDELCDLVDKALSFKGVDRPQSVEEFQNKIKGWKDVIDPIKEIDHKKPGESVKQNHNIKKPKRDQYNQGSAVKTKPDNHSTSMNIVPLLIILIGSFMFAILIYTQNKNDLEKKEIEMEISPPIVNNNQGKPTPTKNRIQDKRKLASACENLAGSPVQKDINVGGVSLDKINGPAAIEVCKKAVSVYPNKDKYQFMLGRAFYAEKKYAQALTWYLKAANQGYVLAQYNLGGIYRYARGVNRDYKTARYWYTKAALQGDSNAKKVLNEIENLN